MKVVRWILTPIVACIGAVVLHFLYNLINPLWGMGVENCISIGNICGILIRDFMVGVSFVALATIVAPEYKHVVSIVFATILGVIVLFNLVLFLPMADGSWIEYLSSVVSAGGGVYTAFNFYNSERD